MTETLSHSLTKIVRPFKGYEAIADALDGCRIRLRENGEFLDEAVLVLKIEDTGTAAPAVTHGIDRLALIDLLEKVGLVPSDVDFGVVLTIGGIKKSIVARHIPLTELDDDLIDLGTELTPYLGAHGGAQVSLMLALRHDLVAKPLSPSRLGQWLARRVFTIKPEQPNYEFKILPLTTVVRTRLKLPIGVAHFIENRGSINDPETTLAEAVIVYFDETIYNAFGRSGNSPVSAALQKSFLADIAAGMVIQELAGEDIQIADGSPLDRFFGDLAKSSGISRERLVAWAKDDHAVFKAHVQAILELTHAVRAAL